MQAAAPASWPPTCFPRPDLPSADTNLWGSPDDSILKNLLPMQETWVQSLGWEDPLEGKGNPLQHSCLGNTMDRRA